MPIPRVYKNEWHYGTVHWLVINYPAITNPQPSPSSNLSTLGSFRAASKIPSTQSYWVHLQIAGWLLATTMTNRTKIQISEC